MRNYGCYLYHKHQLGKEFFLFKNNNTACWAGIRWYLEHKIKTIYVSDFEEPETKTYLDLMIDTINQITPCRIVHLDHPLYHTGPGKAHPNSPKAITVGSIIKVEGQEKGKHPYIKINLLKTYDQSLVVLNFLRSLWSEPKRGYSYTLLDGLKQSNPNDDPLVRLTQANIPACKNAFANSMLYEGDHCNLYRNPQVRTSEDLYKWEGTSVKGFIAI